MAGTSTPPIYTNTPLSILPTPKFETAKDDAFTIEASHMALSHNSFIRGFNSIYQQAPRIQPKDEVDFIGYALAWQECVSTHHHYEETEFFPAVEKAAGKKGLMDGAVQEHAEFHGGLRKFKEYLQRRNAKFVGTELVDIMDSFKDSLHSHLAAEPPTIVRLAKYHTPENPIDILAIADAAGKKQLSVGFIFNVMPVFLLNMETVEFEGGMWHDVFPPFRGAVKTIFTKGVPMWNSGRWRFTSCSADGTVKQLAV